MSVIEEKPNETLNESIHHKWLHDDSFENLCDFNRFINWLSGEFILYQQDEFHGLTVFLPNGWFSIEQLNLNKNAIEFRIEVKSKCFKSGVKIFNQVKLILNRLKHFKSKIV